MAKELSFLNLSRVGLLQRLVPNSSSSRVLQTGRVWLKILLRGQDTIFLRRENKVEHTVYRWVLIICRIWFSWLLVGYNCSAPIKLSSVFAALMLAASSCCEFSSGWHFALFCGGELLVSSNFSVEISMMVPWCLKLIEFCKVICKVVCSKAQQRWEFDIYALERVTGDFVLESDTSGSLTNHGGLQGSSSSRADVIRFTSLFGNSWSIYYTRQYLLYSLYLWRIKPIQKCCGLSKYDFRYCLNFFSFTLCF